MQNLSLVSACRAPSWECEETHSERAPEGLWLDAQPHPLFAPDGDSFLLLAAVQEGDKEHFTHIKHVTLTQQRIAVLSHGRYEVSEVASGHSGIVVNGSVTIMRKSPETGDRDPSVGHEEAPRLLLGNQREKTRPETPLRGARSHRGRSSSFRAAVRHV